MSGKIFVNYRRDDVKADARGIAKALEAKFGEGGVFMDVRDLSGGQVFDAIIVAELARADVLVAVIGPNWVPLLKTRLANGSKDLMRQEIAMALVGGAIVIPVLIDRAANPKFEDLPDDIRDLMARETEEVGHKHFDRDVDTLIRVIQARRAERDRPAEATNPATLARPERKRRQPLLPSWAKIGFGVVGICFLVLILEQAMNDGNFSSELLERLNLKAPFPTREQFLTREMAAFARQGAKTSGQVQPDNDDRFVDSGCPGTCPTMVVLRRGSFTMGSDGRSDDEKPVHIVNIGYHLAVGQFAVTFSLLAELSGLSGRSAA
jgi:TIR domain